MEWTRSTWCSKLHIEGHYNSTGVTLIYGFLRDADCRFVLSVVPALVGDCRARHRVALAWHLVDHHPCCHVCALFVLLLEVCALVASRRLPRPVPFVVRMNHLHHHGCSCRVWIPCAAFPCAAVWILADHHHLRRRRRHPFLLWFSVFFTSWLYVDRVHRRRRRCRPYYSVVPLVVVVSVVAMMRMV